MSFGLREETGVGRSRDSHPKPSCLFICYLFHFMTTQCIWRRITQFSLVTIHSFLGSITQPAKTEVKLMGKAICLSIIRIKAVILLIKRTLFNCEGQYAIKDRVFHFTEYIRRRQNNGKAADKKQDLASALTRLKLSWCGVQWGASRQTLHVFVFFLNRHKC